MSRSGQVTQRPPHMYDRTNGTTLSKCCSAIFDNIVHGYSLHTSDFNMASAPRIKTQFDSLRFMVSGSTVMEICTQRVLKFIPRPSNSSRVSQSLTGGPALRRLVTPTPSRRPYQLFHFLLLILHSANACYATPASTTIPKTCKQYP